MAFMLFMVKIYSSQSTRLVSPSFSRQRHCPKHRLFFGGSEYNPVGLQKQRRCHETGALISNPKMDTFSRCP